MLCVQAWCSITPGVDLVAKQRVALVTKLGHSFLGWLDPFPFGDKDATTLELVTYVRKVQEVAATLLKHPTRPSAYLQLWVGDTIITPAPRRFGVYSDDIREYFRDFHQEMYVKYMLSFVKTATQIKAMWDEDDTDAMFSLNRRNVVAELVEPGTLVVQRDDNLVPDRDLLHNDLEVFSYYGKPISKVETCHSALMLSHVGMFPDIKELCQTSGWLGLTRFDDLGVVCFSSLATNQTLESLTLRLVGRLEGSIGLMDNLTRLCVTIQKSSQIPSELGELINLTYLRLEKGFDGYIPSELGNLHSLAYLGINSSRIVVDIPSELGQLTNLSVLSFKQNKHLTCKLPKELNQLKSLKTINLSGSHGVHHQNVMTRGSWTRNVWKNTL